jgi:hypothetical protein
LHLILSNSFVGLPSSLLLSNRDDLASTLAEKFGEAATSAAVNQVATTAIPKIPAIPEMGGIFDILRNIAIAIRAVAFLLGPESPP